MELRLFCTNPSKWSLYWAGPQTISYFQLHWVSCHDSWHAYKWYICSWCLMLSASQVIRCLFETNWYAQTHSLLFIVRISICFMTAIHETPAPEASHFYMDCNCQPLWGLWSDTGMVVWMSIIHEVVITLIYHTSVDPSSKWTLTLG